MPYEIEFADSVRDQLRSPKSYQRKRLVEAIEEQLPYEPTRETRNRKLLRPNPVAPWDLRVSSLRVFYDVAFEGSKVVRILAVGQKRGNKLLIAGREVEL